MLLLYRTSKLGILNEKNNHIPIHLIYPVDFISECMVFPSFFYRISVSQTLSTSVASFRIICWWTRDHLELIEEKSSIQIVVYENVYFRKKHHWFHTKCCAILTFFSMYYHQLFPLECFLSRKYLHNWIRHFITAPPAIWYIYR